MLRRVVLFTVFISAAFFASLVVTGRMRSAGESAAAIAAT